MDRRKDRHIKNIALTSCVICMYLCMEHLHLMRYMHARGNKHVKSKLRSRYVDSAFLLAQISHISVCKAGYGRENRSLACTQCTDGSFSGESDDQCTDCGDNELTGGAGADDATDCG